MKKQDVMEMLSHLPDEVDPERLMGELYLKAKLERAEEAAARGEVFSHEEVVQRSGTWFK